VPLTGSRSAMGRGLHDGSIGRSSSGHKRQPSVPTSVNSLRAVASLKYEDVYFTGYADS
jgi:hypothetical protein